MLNILSFLQRWWPIFEKGGKEKSRGVIYKEKILEPLGNFVIYGVRVI